MSSYTNKTKVEAYLQRALNSNEDVMLPAYISAASNQINTFLNRQYYDLPEEGDPEDPDQTSRLYDGSGRRELNIDDCKDVSKIEVLDSQGAVLLTIEPPETGVADFITYAHNNQYVESIYLRNNIFPVGSARVRVTAIFGSGPVPAEVVAVCTMMVGNMVTNQYLNATGGEFDQESIEGYSYKRRAGDTAGQAESKNAQLFEMIASFKKYTL